MMDQNNGLSSSPSSNSQPMLAGSRVSHSGAENLNWAWVSSLKKKGFSSERRNSRFKKHHLTTVETGFSLILVTEKQNTTNAFEVCETGEGSSSDSEFEGSSSIGSVELKKAKPLSADESLHTELHFLENDDLDLKDSAQKYTQFFPIPKEVGSTAAFIEERQRLLALKFAPSLLEQQGIDRRLEEQDIPRSPITEVSIRGQHLKADSNARTKTIFVEHNGDPQPSLLEGLDATLPLCVASQDPLSSSHNLSGNIVNSFSSTNVGFLSGIGTFVAQLDAAGMDGKYLIGDKEGKDREEVERGRKL
ncbi:PREDICTED: uncharacterized protein LOC104587663 [Nelumbo nucifera]|uniref:Uncharacterized protein LOC104587663 n=1 Tax=Nelumbo nucifera TaxID=4432 RepID=A0A1U8Q0P4_NELNU|nr:PREDICTED: uncharacterized protein LOC104587663 [Nelumbo nucifera]XP_019051601.1 PREDICTED: uncharacterized protein LOC104587663 [Nelumbo nucifera]